MSSDDIIYVFAGDFHRARVWAGKNDFSATGQDWIFVGSARVIQGLRGFTYGLGDQWWQHPEAREIIDIIKAAGGEPYSKDDDLCGFISVTMGGSHD